MTTDVSKELYSIAVVFLSFYWKERLSPYQSECTLVADFSWPFHEVIAFLYAVQIQDMLEGHATVSSSWARDTATLSHSTFKRVRTLPSGAGGTPTIRPSIPTATRYAFWNTKQWKIRLPCLTVFELTSAKIASFSTLFILSVVVWSLTLSIRAPHTTVCHAQFNWVFAVQLWTCNFNTRNFVHTCAGVTSHVTKRLYKRVPHSVFGVDFSVSFYVAAF